MLLLLGYGILLIGAVLVARWLRRAVELTEHEYFPTWEPRYWDYFKGGK